MNKRGNAMIFVLLIALIVAAALQWYSNYIMNASRGAVNRITRQQALENAESGLQEALSVLRAPNYFASNPGPLISTSIPNGRYEVSLASDPFNASLVDSYATGYYLNGNTSVRAVLYGKIKISQASEFAGAVPGPLTIAYGSDLGAGSVYARNLTFQSGAGNPQTQVGKAFYSESVNDPAPSYVTFTAAPFKAQQLPSAPSLTALGGDIASYYQARQSSDPFPVFQNTVTASTGPPPHVYYQTGDLDIGTPGNDVQVSGAFLVYVTGQVNIHSNILLSGPDPNTNWIAILSEKDIVIAADAPSNLTLYGTFVTNGQFRVDTSQGAKTDLSFNGGFLANGGFQLGTGFQGTRQYNYVTSNNPGVLLPNFTTLLETKIIEGRTGY